uniref:Uncharacterized protein n=1 Tax=Aplanochytrium stocchinoi TaxID=215587 RepID=A0A6S8DTX3_9STRA|mmetsp:Transcript_11021/g.13783  ORF Transcript_11021/g.13783 Transcript_11021/m.13783 type:complete len:269 (+) Transcript_11021:109-915(+)
MEGGLNNGKFESIAHSASCCNTLALVLGLFVVFSPFYLWNSEYTYAGTYNRVATGPFIVSSTSETFNCGLWCVGVIDAQWNSFDEINSDNACTNDTNIFTEWSGKYGFCDSIGGTYSKPTEVKVLQAFVVMLMIFLILGSCAGCSVRSSKSKGLFLAAGLTFVSMICSIVAFSIVASSEWYTDLRNGVGSLPVKNNVGQLTAMTSVKLYYGPAYICMIIIFLVLLISTCNYCAAAKYIDKEYEDKFDLDQESSSSPTGEYADGQVVMA